MAETKTAKRKRERAAREKSTTEKLSQQDVQRLEDRIQRIVPSQPWRDDLFAMVFTIPAVIPHKTKMAGEFDRAGVFPPGGRIATLMTHCNRCGSSRWFPPQYLAQGVCADCVEIARAPKDHTPKEKTENEIKQRIYMDQDGAIWGQKWEVEILGEVIDLPPTPPNYITEARDSMRETGDVLIERPLASENINVLQRMIERHVENEKQPQRSKNAEN